jgi:uncharacterized protein (DUF983 family)
MKVPPSLAPAPQFNPTRNPMKTGLRGLCPQCQKGAIFDGYLKIVDKCALCGLDYSFADPADGPAFFAMSIVAVPAMSLGLWLELSFQVPYWAHLLTTLPFTLIGCLLCLRLLKGWLISSEYYHQLKSKQTNSKS